MLSIARILSCVSSCCLVACGTPTQDVSSALEEIEQREIAIPNYPQVGRSYLSFDHAHGFQVTYLGENGVSWLWYPGNDAAVPARFAQKTVGGIGAMCWRYPSNSFNPVTRTTGGVERCSATSILRKRTVSELKGDPFGLSHGKVPYRLSKCVAPNAFIFDRSQVGC